MEWRNKKNICVSYRYVVYC